MFCNAICATGFNIHDTGDITFEDVENDTPFANLKRPRAVGNANKLVSTIFISNVLLFLYNFSKKC